MYLILGLIGALVEALIVKLNDFILLLESFLKLLDLILEPFFLLLMLGPESNDLVIGLLIDLLAYDVILVLALSFFLSLSNILL